jgi:hypothetical protein
VGAFHATRGVTPTGVFDIGTLVPELAALRGGASFNLMVIGGANALQAQLDPRTMTVAPVPVEPLAALGLQALAAVLPDTPGPVLLDLRPMRPLLSGARLPAFDRPGNRLAELLPLRRGRVRASRPLDATPERQRLPGHCERELRAERVGVDFAHAENTLDRCKMGARPRRKSGADSNPRPLCPRYDAPHKAEAPLQAQAATIRREEMT